MELKTWIAAFFLLTMVKESEVSYLRFNPTTSMDSGYRRVIGEAPDDELKYAAFRPFEQCNQRTGDLWLTYHRRIRKKKFIFWADNLKEFSYKLKLMFYYEAGLITPVLDRDEQFLPMNFGPYYYFFTCVLMFFVMIWIYFIGGVLFLVTAKLWSYVSFQPIRRVIRARVIHYEILQRRKEAYLRKVIIPGLRRPPKNKFRLYWMWRDYTYEEIPDALAETEIDKLYPRIKGPGSSTSDDEFANWGDDDEEELTPEELEEREFRRQEEERLRLLEIERDKMVTAIAWEQLPISKRIAIGFDVPYAEEKKIIKWRKKAELDWEAEKKKRREARLIKLKNIHPERASFYDAQLKELKGVKTKPLTLRQREEQEILRLKMDELLEELPDKDPISMSLKYYEEDEGYDEDDEDDVRALAEKREAEKRKREHEKLKVLYQREQLLKAKLNRKSTAMTSPAAKAALEKSKFPVPDPNDPSYYAPNKKLAMQRQARIEKTRRKAERKVRKAERQEQMAIIKKIKSAKGKKREELKKAELRKLELKIEQENLEKQKMEELRKEEIKKQREQEELAARWVYSDGPPKSFDPRFPGPRSPEDDEKIHLEEPEPPPKPKPKPPKKPKTPKKDVKKW